VHKELDKNPTLESFHFDYGVKNLRDCTNAELLVVVKYLAAEVDASRKAHKLTRDLLIKSLA